MKTLYILDVSGYLFRAYYALPPMTNANGEATHALFGFLRSLYKLLEEKNPTHIVAVFDGPDNKKQRREIYEKYKANRTKIADDLPEQIERAKEACELMGVPHIEVPGVEADDTMGSIAKWANSLGSEVFLCTADKDLAQLVGGEIRLLNPWKENRVLDSKGVEEVYGVPPSLIIDLLALMGDSSDNIPGVKGFGPKTAKALLTEFGSLQALLEHPEKVKGAKKQEALRNEADTALLSQKLATIHTNIPFEKEPSAFALQTVDEEALRQFFLKMNFKSFLKKLGASESAKEAIHYTLVDDEKSLQKLRDHLQQAQMICFDTETTSLNAMEAKLVGVGLGVKPGEAFYLPCNGKLGQKRVFEFLTPLFGNPGLGFFGHNVKYDCHVLVTNGLPPPKIVFDTLLASYLLNSASRRHGLDELALSHFGKVMTPIKELIGSGRNQKSMEEVEIPLVSDYCCEDVDFTIRLKKLLEKELEKKGLVDLFFELELPLIKILYKMEQAGVYIDCKAVEELRVEVQEKIEVLQEKIIEIAGKPFNLNSPKQLAQVLFEDLGIPPLKKGASGYSTRAEVLEELAIEHEIASLVLDYRSLEKLRSTYIEPLPEQINPKTNRIHPTFNQSVTATGRLSCQDPNLQNIPVRTALGKKIRNAFRPQKPGWSFLSADYSQIELRLLAHFSEDPELLRAFRAGEDIHTHTAAQILEIPQKNVTPAERHLAKAINFGIIYGQGPFGLAKEVGIPFAKAKAFIDAYFKRYERVGMYISSCIEEARENGKAVTMMGRERELPELTSRNAQLRAQAERLAVNTPLQGSAADLIKLAMLSVSEEIQKKQFDSFLVLQIHDELIFEVPDQELPKMELLVKKGMENVCPLQVPLLVDIEIGKKWGG